MLSALLIAGAVAPPAAQQIEFADVLTRLKSPDAAVRIEAIETVRQTNLAQGVVPVAPLVIDVDDRVQLAAIDAELALFLAEDIGAGDPAARAERAFDGAPFTILPRPVPRELVTGLLRAAADDNPRVRVSAAYLLGAIAPPRSLTAADAQAFATVLQSSDPETRTAIARVAGRLQVKDAGAALVHAMNDAAPPVRFAAIHAVGELRFERAVQALADFVSYYGTGEVGVAAYSALAQIAHGSSVPMFRAGLTNGNAAIRRISAEGAGRARDAVTIDQLAVLGRDKDPGVRAAAAFALQLLGRDALDRLVPLLADARVHVQVRDCLLELGSSIAQPLARFLQSPEPPIRHGIVEVLGITGGPDAVNALGVLSQDPDPQVRAAVARALERLRLRRPSTT